MATNWTSPAQPFVSVSHSYGGPDYAKQINDGLAQLSVVEAADLALAYALMGASGECVESIMRLAGPAGE